LNLSNNGGVSSSSMVSVVSNNLREMSGAIVHNLSYITFSIICMVVDMLDPAIREVHRVGAHP